jgi:hypothetical protein
MLLKKLAQTKNMKNKKNNTKQVWVSPDPNGGWRVHKPGAVRDISHITNKKDAVERAKNIAIRQKGELKIQKKNGKIQEANTYGRDPFPPRG